MRYGMGDKELGLVSYGEKQGTMFLGADPATNRNYSESMAQHIDEFVRTTIDEQYARAEGILKKHKGKLDELCVILLQKETMTVEEFLEIFDGTKPKPKEVDKEEAQAEVQE
jgi:cell division protease FtsH